MSLKWFHELQANNNDARARAWHLLLGSFARYLARIFFIFAERAFISDSNIRAWILRIRNRAAFGNLDRVGLHGERMDLNYRSAGDGRQFVHSHVYPC